ncbi:MAG: FeoB small GTPase domain-containing protein [Bacillota bacterium]
MAKTPIVAVAGNPNSGKTTLFNGLTGSKQRIGNWPGVTVEKKEGSLSIEGKNITLVDLPGVYSLSAHSEDERIARDFILNGETDLVLNIVDATNLERNLYLTTQLLDMKVPVLLAVNMQDLADKKGITIDLKLLKKKLGCPVIGISAVNQGDINKVKAVLADALQNGVVSDIQATYPQEVEEAIIQWTPLLEGLAQDLGANPRWVALKLMEQDQWITDKVSSLEILSVHAINEKISSLESVLGDSSSLFKVYCRMLQKYTVDAKSKGGTCG